MSQTATQSELLDPLAMARLGQLELISKRVVEGLISGMHRSPFKGGCVEFSEHRAYSPGDEVRLIDWRVFGRSDRYYIKQFEEETNLQATLVLDASGSMAFGQSTVSKFRYAQMAAACLARLLLYQRDAVGLATIDTKVRSYVVPRSRANHFQAIIQALEHSRPRGETSLAGVLHELAARLRRRGIIVLLSDAFDDVEALLNAFRHLQLRGHEVLLLHVMAPEELSFSFSRWSRFESLEDPGRWIELDPPAIRKRYLKRVAAFLERLRTGCAEMDCDYVPMSADRPLVANLTYYLKSCSAALK